jgi:hypothetical protein
MTTSDRDDRIMLLLGELKAGLAGVREDMQEVKDAAAMDRRDSRESRQRIYEKVEEGERRLVAVESTVRVLGGVIEKAGQRLDKLEPQVDLAAGTIKRWTVRGGFVGTGVVALGGFVWWLVQSNGPFLWAGLLRLLRGT